MQILLKLLLLPFKALDEGLEILLFKVIFHRRLWFITVPATVALCWFGWQQWKLHHPAPVATPSPIASPRGPSPAPRPSPAQVTQAPGELVPSPAAAIPKPMPSARAGAALAASPKPFPSPKLAAGPKAASPKPPATPALAASPKPASPSPAASPRLARATPLPDDLSLDDDPKPSSAPQSAPGPSTGDPALFDPKLVAAVAKHPAVVHLTSLGAAPLTTADLDLVSAAASRADVRPALAGRPGAAVLFARVIGGDTAAAGELTQLPPLEVLGGGLEPAAYSKLLTAAIKQGPRDLKLATLEALFASDRLIPNEIGAAVGTLLSTRDRAITEAAARVISRLNDRTLAPVLEAIGGGLKGEERVAVARALAAMRSTKVREDLVNGLASKTNSIRAHALHGLADLGEEVANPVAKESAADPDYLLRQAAAHVLAEIGDDHAADVLGADLASPLDMVRAGALATLAALSEKAQVKVVTHMIGQKTLPGAARLAALRMLAASPSRSATPTLQGLLANPKGIVRLAIADELHPAQAKMLKPLLLKQLEVETVPEVKLALARALAGEPASDVALLKLASTAPALRPRIAPVLARACPARLPELLKLFTPAEAQSSWGYAATLRAGR